jgi:hypothetical protein
MNTPTDKQIVDFLAAEWSGANGGRPGEFEYTLSQMVGGPDSESVYTDVMDFEDFRAAMAFIMSKAGKL